MIIYLRNMLSIIIPVYNIERYLSYTIESVIKQSYSNWELILVNDGSTDRSRIICEEYEKKDSRIRVINQQNKGLSWATYNGLKNAKGDYIAFADHDDIMLPNLFAELFPKLSEDVDIACCSRIDLHDDELEKYIWQGTEKITIVSGRTAVENTIKPVDYNLQLPLWGRIYRKSFLDNFDFTKYAELLPTLFMVDIFVTPQILFFARKVAFTNKVLYIHREVSTSISRSLRLSPFYFEQISSFPILLNFYKENNLQSLYLATLRQYANSCLMRLSYKIISSNYPEEFITEINKSIKTNFSCIYKELMKNEKSFIYRLSYIIFNRFQYIWIKTFGCCYFQLFGNLKSRLKKC